METRRLPSVDVPISRLGLGTVTFGREIDEPNSCALMDYAVDRGINLFDTAEAYGGGQSREYRRTVLKIDDIREVSGEYHSSEKIIGRWLHSTRVRDKIVLVSKVTTNFRRAHVREAVEASLERLQTDYLDVYLFHNFDSGTPLPDALEAMEDVRRSGLVKATGCSNFTSEQVRQALVIAGQSETGQLGVVESILNLAARESELDLLPLCREHKLAFLAYSPLGAGFLTGKYSDSRNHFPLGSRFDVIPAHADVYFSEQNFQTVRELHETAATLQIPAERLAVAWVLAHPEVSSVLFGARTVAQIDNALAASELAAAHHWTWPASLEPRI